MEQAIAFAHAQLGYQKLRKSKRRYWMHLSAVETFCCSSGIGYCKSLCFDLLPLIGRTAYPAALDNLRRPLTLFPQQRHTVQASTVIVHASLLCGYM